ncbi:MAG: SMI1/KNR4 family protein, partial [Pseudomonadota bacterium]
WNVTGSDIGLITAFILLMVPMTGVIAFAERAKPETLVTEKSDATKAPDNASQAVWDEDGDFGTIAREITPDTFFNGWHFSRRNSTGMALTDIVDHKGDKPKREPKQASEAMVAETEKRLGVKLPETLRNIYKVQDGGSLPTFFVPKRPDAPRTHDNWLTAFAYDYDVLNPLKDLRSLRDDYVAYDDPDDPEATQYWIPGSDQLILIAARTGYGTALDYRNGDEPGVLLFDQNEDEKELMRFESFDAFLAACHEIDFDEDLRDGDEPKEVAFGKPPNPLDPDRFWKAGSPGQGVTPEQWSKASAALDVSLPNDLLPFFKASNGGTSEYTVAIPAQDTGTDQPIQVFPDGPYIQPGTFLKLEQWVTLATLSDRLDFIDNRTPWRDLHDEPERLIVISAAFDSALMLDYRDGKDSPGVISIPDLDDPHANHVFPDVETFLTRLRQYGRPAFEEKNEIGDTRISTRLSNADSFWLPDDSIGPVERATIDAFIEEWGFQTFGLPTALKRIYETQNGGRVCYRFAPPQQVNASGYTMTDVSAEAWNDVFPDGLLPMEDWRSFEAWRAEQNLAIWQEPTDFTSRIQSPIGDDDSLTIRTFVIGEHGSAAKRTVTLLDMSSDFFNRNQHIMTVEYDASADRFEIIFGPIYVDNVYNGLHKTMRALKAEL